MSPFWYIGRFVVSPFFMCRRLDCRRFGCVAVFVVAILDLSLVWLPPFWICRRFDLYPRGQGGLIVSRDVVKSS